MVIPAHDEGVFIVFIFLQSLKEFSLTLIHACGVILIPRADLSSRTGTRETIDESFEEVTGRVEQ